MKYLLALTFMLLGSSCFADFYTISGTGLFDTSRGTLNKVSVRFKQDNVAMTVGDHSHTITTSLVGYNLGSNSTVSLDFAVVSLADGSAITTSVVGDHTHSLLPTFTWNSKNISLSPVTSSSGGSHSHGVTNLRLIDDFTGNSRAIVSGTIQDSGAHSQTFSFDQLVDFTGTDLSLFLGPIAPVQGYTGSFNVSSGNHTHIIPGGLYKVQVGDGLGGFTTFDISILDNILLSNSLTGNHSVNLSGNAFETTFDFTPFSSVPEPSSFILFSVVAGAGAVGRRFWRKREVV